jgi:hypothetical protein
MMMMILIYVQRTVGTTHSPKDLPKAEGYRDVLS